MPFTTAIKVCFVDLVSATISLSRSRKLLTLDVIAQPPSTLNKAGTTKAIYKLDNPNDHHHGNEKFGALMFKEI